MKAKKKTAATEQNSDVPPARARSVSELKSNPPGPEPPDSGWAWIVLFGTFMVTFNCVGYTIALGVFFLSWTNEFETTSAAVSIVISLLPFVRGFSSPIVNILFTKFRARAIMMVGGLMFSTGILLTSFGTSVSYLVGTTGVLTAIGSSLAMNANFVMVRCYFKKRYSLALGMTQAGASAGQLALPPLYNWLITEYGWRGALLIISAISLHVIAMGALMRPVKKTSTKADESMKENKTDPAIVASASKAQEASVEQEQTLTDVHTDVKKYAESAHGHKDVALNDVLDNQNDIESSLDTVTLVVADSDDVVSPTEGSETNEDWSDPEEDFSEMHNSPMDPVTLTFTDDHISRVSVAVIHTKPDSLFGYVKLHFQRTKTFLLDTYGLRRLAHNLNFYLVCTMAFSMAYGWSSMNVHLVPRTEYVGIDSEASSLLLSILGGFALVCRPFIGWFVDKHYISAEIIQSTTIAVLALTTFLMPQFTTFGPLAAIVAVLGFCTGVTNSLLLVILHNAVRAQEGVAAMGILFFCWGIGGISGGFFSGFLFDQTDNYNYSFYCSGAVTMCASILVLSNYFLLRAKKRRRRKAAAATAVENPGFLADDKSVPSVKSVLGTAIESTNSDNEVVNSLYSTRKEEARSHVTGSSTAEISSLSPGTFVSSIKQERQLETERTTRLEFSKSGIENEAEDGRRQEVEERFRDVEVEVHEDHTAQTKLVENNNIGFENPSFFEDNGLPAGYRNDKDSNFTSHPVFDNQLTETGSLGNEDKGFENPTFVDRIDSDSETPETLEDSMHCFNSEGAQNETSPDGTCGAHDNSVMFSKNLSVSCEISLNQHDTRSDTDTDDDQTKYQV